MINPLAILAALEADVQAFADVHPVLPLAVEAIAKFRAAPAATDGQRVQAFLDAVTPIVVPLLPAGAASPAIIAFLAAVEPFVGRVVDGAVTVAAHVNADLHDPLPDDGTAKPMPPDAP